MSKSFRKRLSGMEQVREIKQSDDADEGMQEVDPDKDYQSLSEQLSADEEGSSTP